MTVYITQISRKSKRNRENKVSTDFKVSFAAMTSTVNYKQLEEHFLGKILGGETKGTLHKMNLLSYLLTPRINTLLLFFRLFLDCYI